MDSLTLITAGVEWDGMDRFNSEFMMGDVATPRPQTPPSGVTEVPLSKDSTLRWLGADGYRNLGLYWFIKPSPYIAKIQPEWLVSSGTICGWLNASKWDILRGYNQGWEDRRYEVRCTVQFQEWIKWKIYWIPCSNWISSAALCSSHSLLYWWWPILKPILVQCSGSCSGYYTVISKMRETIIFIILRWRKMVFYDQVVSWNIAVSAFWQILLYEPFSMEMKISMFHL